MDAFQSPGAPRETVVEERGVRGVLPAALRETLSETPRGAFAVTRRGRLRVEIDPTPFVGLESTARAVAHLQGGKSIGKVVVDVAANRNAREGLIAASRL